ncbi:putative glycosyl protein [Botrytis fragariae]|uniref:Putative glycosyl protein n=1 Tax=Botrytis fragariae TaxID=1964551 RepID=A0A8H6AI43_9HELO|nr:putative glycosyl protein [Botrytis fragariae]KAF5867754.1 putative glycosyl protein [Botrytis fragariae]
MVFPISESLPYEVDSTFWGKQLNLSTELTESQVNTDITMWLVNSQFRQYKGQRL